MGLQIFCKPIFAGCDMKGKQATYLEIASLCRELALLLHAGVRAGDGLALLAEEEPEAQRRKQLEEMARQVDDGASLGEALAGQGLFPAYVTGLVTVGERSGRTEEALNALSVYYEQRDQLDRQVRSALLYPSVLLVLMLVVIVVLLAKVLPVFDQVYASLGGELTGVAGGLLTLGRALDAAMPVLCAVLGVVVIFLAVFSLSGGFRGRLLAFWQRRFGDRGVSRRLNDARFAQAMAMGPAHGGGTGAGSRASLPDACRGGALPQLQGTAPAGRGTVRRHEGERRAAAGGLPPFGAGRAGRNGGHGHGGDRPAAGPGGKRCPVPEGGPGGAGAGAGDLAAGGGNFALCDAAADEYHGGHRVRRHDA